MVDSVGVAGRATIEDDVVVPATIGSTVEHADTAVISRTPVAHRPLFIATIFPRSLAGLMAEPFVTSQFLPGKLKEVRVVTD